jgi:oligopeptide transport system substrate-binding protein
VDDKKVFHMNLPEGLNTLDPAFAKSRGRIWMCAQLFNGLVELDDNLKVKPSIAQSWDISEDGLTYSFHLRDDVYFHEHEAFGTEKSRKVNARDFEYSFTRICDPVTASSGRWVFNGKIAGLQEYAEGKRDQISGFEVVNDSTFAVHLSRPFPAFLSLLAMPYGFVVPKEVVDHYGADFQAHPIGSGPFKMYRWEEGNILIMHKNEHYFEEENGHPLPYLDAVTVSFIPSRLTAFVELLQGKLDFIGDLDNSYKDEVLNRDGSIKEAYVDKFTFILAPQLNTEYLGFQMLDSMDFMKGSPLLDLRVRQALNFAIDRDKICKYLLNGMGYPANEGFVSRGMPGFTDSLEGYEFNLQKAKGLLTEAGYPNGEGIPELTLNATAEYAPIMAFVQKSLENIGVKVNIQNLQGGALRREIYSGRVAFWRASWIADYPDGENYLSLFYTPNHAPAGPNTTHFSNPAFDQLYEKALLTSDDSLRQQIYQQMDQMVLDVAPIIPLYYDRSFRMLKKGWTGLGANPMNHLQLKRVR